MLGVLLIDKPEGLTSHDVVNRVRRKLSTKRVGHAGTLDPIATGLLVVAVGPATRFLQYLPLEPKVYEAQIRFGHSSSTYDSEGELSEHVPPPDDLRSAIEAVLPLYRGMIEQLPPMHSAIKVKGQPLYKYARMGQELERKTRNVHIAEFSVSGVDGDKVSARIECSGGTYVRSLAHDVGAELGCGAYLTGLRRTRVGAFHVDDACGIDDVCPERLLSLSQALPPMPLIQMDEVSMHSIREGRCLEIEPVPSARLVALQQPDGEVFSIARVEGNLLHPECVIPAGVFDGTI